MTLSTLPLHQPARIVAVTAGEGAGGQGPSASGRAYRRRLLELGFLPGVEVTVRGVAPMGDPLDLEIRGCRFSLRRAEAACIQVSPGGGARG